MEFDVSQLQLVVAALVAYALDLIPGAKAWWDTKFNSQQKQFAMLILMFLIAVGGALYACYGRNGVCPLNWVDFIINTFVQFVINTIVNVGSHLTVRYLPQEEADRKDKMDEVVTEEIG